MRANRPEEGWSAQAGVRMEVAGLGEGRDLERKAEKDLLPLTRALQASTPGEPLVATEEEYQQSRKAWPPKTPVMLAAKTARSARGWLAPLSHPRGSSYLLLELPREEA